MHFFNLLFVYVFFFFCVCLFFSSLFSFFFRSSPQRRECPTWHITGGGQGVKRSGRIKKDGGMRQSSGFKPRGKETRAMAGKLVRPAWKPSTLSISCVVQDSWEETSTQSTPTNLANTRRRQDAPAVGTLLNRPLLVDSANHASTPCSSRLKEEVRNQSGHPITSRPE